MNRTFLFVSFHFATNFPAQAFEGTEFAATRHSLTDCVARPDLHQRCDGIDPPNDNSTFKLLPRQSDDSQRDFKESAGIYDGWPQERSVFIGSDDSFAVVVNGKIVFFSSSHASKGAWSAEAHFFLFLLPLFEMTTL